ncbi:hypothetical protein ABEV74_01330 [Paenibacillus cisolokensis]|uniref:hypothetical protein n=1 Tax=Paenibacillus cisolokensis TaxID=1658519 RepID=UPI003D28017B
MFAFAYEVKIFKHSLDQPFKNGIHQFHFPKLQHVGVFIPVFAGELPPPRGAVFGVVNPAKDGMLFLRPAPDADIDRGSERRTDTGIEICCSERLGT